MHRQTNHGQFVGDENGGKLAVRLPDVRIQRGVSQGGTMEKPKSPETDMVSSKILGEMIRKRFVQWQEEGGRGRSSRMHTKNRNSHQAAWEVLSEYCLHDWSKMRGTHMQAEAGSGTGGRLGRKTRHDHLKFPVNHMLMLAAKIQISSKRCFLSTDIDEGIGGWDDICLLLHTGTWQRASQLKDDGAQDKYSMKRATKTSDPSGCCHKGYHVTRLICQNPPAVFISGI